MHTRTLISCFIYAAAFATAVVITGVVVETAEVQPPAFAGPWLTVCIAAVAAAFVCRRLTEVSPVRAAGTVLIGGLIALACTVVIVRDISLPTGYPHSWPQAANHVLELTQIAGLVLASAAAALTLALARRLLPLR